MPLKDPEYQNSAGRLLALLTSLKNNQNLIEEVPKILGKKVDDAQQKQQLALSFLMDMHHVYLEFRQDMLDAEINDQQRDVLLSGLSSVQQSLYPVQLNAGWREITEAEVSLLKVCATFIAQDAPITKDELEAIRASISDLRSQVESGSLSPTLRKALLELIRLSEDAISRFNIYGARGLKKVFKSMLADAAELYGMTDSQNNAEELKKSGAWRTIIRHLKLVDSIASKLMKYRPLLQGASTLLLGNSHETPNA